VKTTLVRDTEQEHFTRVVCPTCANTLLDFDTLTSGKQVDKIMSWTVAQLAAFMRLQHNSGIELSDLIDRTSGGVMPGISGALNGDVGTIGVSDFHGIFVGIEPDGYTHS